MYKLAIFDLDGTLVNSIEDIADASNYALKKLGFPTHETEKFYHFVGDGINKLCERILPADKQEFIPQVLEYYNEFYSIHFADKTKAYDGMNELTEKLHANGIHLAVASNKTDCFVATVIKSCYKDGLFDIVLGNSPDRRRKPSGDIIEAILMETGFDKSETLMIGDTNVDVKTAKNAGVKSIGCLWGFRDENELVTAGADYIARKPADIAEIFLG